MAFNVEWIRMIFLGIDIGYDRCGICILDHNYDNNEVKLLFAGSILTDKTLTISSRLKIIHDDLLFIKEKYSPDHVSIEKLFFNRKNSVFEKICMSKGVAMMLFQDSNIVEVEPKVVKKNIVGDGSANKAQIKHFLSSVMKSDLSKVLDDTLDALCLALYNIDMVKYEQLHKRNIFSTVNIK